MADFDGFGAENPTYSTDVDEAVVDRIRGWIDEAQRIVVLTGAGISTDSGIADFRGPQGVWTKNPEAERTSTLRNYLADPDLRKRRWQSLLENKDVTRLPNDGHRAIVELQTRGKLLAVLTQNVDGLHQDAGTDPSKIVEIHGTTRNVKCLECGEEAPMERALARVEAGEEDPPCRTCGGILKSATISFGQNLIGDDLLRAEIVAKNCDLMLAVGSTLGVYPIAGVVPLAKQEGAMVVILNGQPTEMDMLADAVIHGSISDVLPRLVTPLE